MSKPIEIRSKEAQGAEVSWFAPICDGDDRYLGERNVKYKSNWENTSNILLAADQLGYFMSFLLSSRTRYSSFCFCRITND